MRHAFLRTVFYANAAFWNADKSIKIAAICQTLRRVADQIESVNIPPDESDDPVIAIDVEDPDGNRVGTCGLRWQAIERLGAGRMVRLPCANERESITRCTKTWGRPLAEKKHWPNGQGNGGKGVGQVGGGHERWAVTAAFLRHVES